MLLIINQPGNRIDNHIARQRAVVTDGRADGELLRSKSASPFGEGLDLQQHQTHRIRLLSHLLLLALLSTGIIVLLCLL